MFDLGIVWLTDDLRVRDNPLLQRAARECRKLLCVYCLDVGRAAPNRYGLTSMGVHRERFLRQGLAELDSALRQRGQHLHLLEGHPARSIAQLLAQTGAQVVYHNRSVAHDERRVMASVRAAAPEVTFTAVDQTTLFELDQLPFDLADCPPTFSQFRKRVETIAPPAALPAPEAMPPSPFDPPERLPTPAERGDYTGGEAAGLARLDRYLWRDAVRDYKQRRNALDGWDNSSKLSPWLAQGSLSARQVASALADYEAERGANESTYWLYFELLWREYFQWYARAHGARLFRFAGLARTAPLTSFYPERFRRWCEGATPYPLVNAGMRELNATGYMTNRMRQIVASALVNELSVDWRYGAAYFQQQLIDYNVGSNWGNWQYIAGVGADAKGGRHFNLAKQAAQFDPDAYYTRHWGGDQNAAALDSVDAHDWPVWPAGRADDE